MSTEHKTANSTVQIVAPPGEWSFERQDADDEPPEYKEQWNTDLTDTPDLIVTLPNTTVEQLQTLRSQFPTVDLLIATQHEDPSVDFFLGDQSVYFMIPPSTVEQMRACIVEVLSFRIERQELLDSGSDVPAVQEHVPVAGWFELTGPSHPVFLRRFRTWMASLRALPISERERARLEHAVREVGWNAIEWGNRFDLRRRLHLAFMTLEDRLAFRVEDEGGAEGWYDELVRRDTAAEQKRRREAGIRYGGFGLILVEKIMDRVEISSKGHIVVMEKFFSPESVQ
ncbi:MAG: ATP-binding protein [Planctomycetota bacterium]